MTATGEEIMNLIPDRRFRCGFRSALWTRKRKIKSCSKIDLDLSVLMLLEGKSRADVAKFFGVTHQSLTEFLRNWRPDLVGKRRGPKSRIDYVEAERMKASGKSMEEIAAHYGVHYSAACRAVNHGRHGINS